VRPAGASAVLSLVALVLVPSFACGPIVGTPLSDAPINACGTGQFSCDRYLVDGIAAKPQCTRDDVTLKSRCDFGRPDYPYTVVVHVPDSSFFAPGRTFMLTNNDLTAQPGAPVDRRCNLAEDCVRLPELVEVQGQYRATPAAAKVVGMELPEETSIPVRVAFVPFAPEEEVEAYPHGLPVDDLRFTSRLIQKAKGGPAEVSFLDAVSVGRYQRVLYPQPPFDAFFPPAFRSLAVSEAMIDDFVLGAPAAPPVPNGRPSPCLDNQECVTPLDADADQNRITTITREEGLDGWRVWLADDPALGGRRLSAVKTLAGVEATVILHTVGAGQEANPALRDKVDVIIAPPEGSIAVPRLESRIVNGGPFGFRFLEIPPLPAPVSFTGVIAQGDGALTGIPSRLTFTSSGLFTREGESDTTLKYATAVFTDDTGHFATVLPSGRYEVTIEPTEGTGFSKATETLDTAATVARTFRPPPRTVAFGRAVLADGRPLSGADVIALPSAAPLVGGAVEPRPARTRTDREGNFKFEVDQGEYNLMVDPQAGTDFPRVIQIRSFSGSSADVGEIIVAPPARLPIQLKDPSVTGNPIIRAVVRVFAELPGRGPPVLEIGQGMTDSDGRCEILLAPRPR
jgi:hypothetical protein